MAGTVTMDLEHYNALQKAADRFVVLEDERQSAMHAEARRLFPTDDSADLAGRRKFHGEHEAVIRVLIVPKAPK